MEKTITAGKNKPTKANTARMRTLQDVLQMVYLYNTDIALAFNKVKSAQEDCFMARATWFPTVELGAKAVFSPSKNFTTQNVATIDFVQERSFEQKIKDRSGVLNFAIAQNIYNGGATQAKNQGTLESYKVAFCEFNAVVQSALKGAADCFLDMLNAREVYLITKMREKSLSELREIARNRAIVGDQRMADFSIANAQCIRMSINANKSFQEYMDKKMELEVSSGQVFSDENTEFPSPLEVDLFEIETFIQICLKQNPLIQKFAHAERARRWAVKEQAASFLPRVIARLEGQTSNSRRDFDNIGYQSDPNRSSGSGLTASVEVGMIIFDGGLKAAAYRTVELASKAARLEQEANKRNLIVLCRRQFHAYQLALQNVVSAREAYKEQAAAFSSARQEYALGATSMVDLVGLEEQYAASMRELIETMSTLTKISYELKRLAGQLTPDMLQVQGKKYSIEAYREEYRFNLFALGENQSKTTLYETAEPSDAVVGSDLLKLFDRTMDQKGMKSGMKDELMQFFGWYPVDGVAPITGQEKENLDKDAKKIKGIVQGLEVAGEENKIIEKLMAESLGNNVLDDIITNSVTPESVSSPKKPVAKDQGKPAGAGSPDGKKKNISG